MDSFIVQGGIALRGKIRIQGSKNAALPILAACLMTKDQVVLENCPKIADIRGMISILESLGCQLKWDGNTLLISAQGPCDGVMPGDIVGSMRSSVFLLGALLGRGQDVELDEPGGCVIGERPIDLHVKGLKQMGVSFERQGTKLCAKAPKGIKGCDVFLEFPSVGATENLVMAATAAKGVTRIYGAAKEPEVQALCEFLRGCGAKIEGIGKSVLTIRGENALHGTVFQIPPDRIVAGTYLLAGFACGGEIFMEDVPVSHMSATMEIAEKMGALLTVTKEGLYVQFPERALELPFVRTDIYPGFPTDLQSILLAVRCTGKGDTILRENIFENRFRIREELQKMGASIERMDDRSVRVAGVEVLRGTVVEARELRGGAALVVAAMGAKGETVIRGRKYIERGYENMGHDLRELGVRIVSV